MNYSAADNAACLLAGSDLVVDALDDAPSRRALAEACTALGRPCLHLILEADGRSAILGWAGDLPPLDSGCEVRSVPGALASRVVDAGLDSIVQFLLTDKKCGRQVFCQGPAGNSRGNRGRRGICV